ncbi:MAG TPA: winged helix-turn-helix domain-containing protein [Candidatus Binatia bacterium]|jgi:GntR family transcriptional regulator/MocR family aminotransferase|nr:winged helix-turn-helix domain-containing protein [Candidatus Binatia bacterium]
MSRISSSLVSALVALDAASPDPLHRQIYLKLRNAILAGRISPGAQIPSSRDLARELGVTRNTVLNAVEQLIAEGYLQGEHGSGARRTLAWV